jgi:pimeloyl-ACP methyl ester carboxylesterase
MNSAACRLRRSRNLLVAAMCATLWVGAACSEQDEPAESVDGGTQDTADVTTDTTDTTAAQASCDPSERPIVFVHGFMGSGDTWANHAMRLSSNGYCHEHIVAFDWNTLDQGENATIARIAELDGRVDVLLAATGATQVDLVGHSAGGGLSYSYLEDAGRAAKVAAYVHVGSFFNEAPAGPEGVVPMLNLWSSADLVIEEKGDIAGAENVDLVTDDHYAVATSAAAFEALYAFLHDGDEPGVSEPTPREPIEISGMALTFAENQLFDGVVRLDTLDPETGAISTDGLAEQLILPIATGGGWGPVEVPAGFPLQFTADGDDPAMQDVTYVLAPPTRSNPLMYVRAFPSANSLVGLLIDAIPTSDDQAVVIFFCRNRAMVAGEDSLTLNGMELLTQDVAPIEQSTIAIFGYDGDGDGESSLESASLFESLPFLAGIDVSVPAGSGEMIEVVYNGQRYRALSRVSETQGPLVFILE